MTRTPVAIPRNLESELADGNAVLFLGSGASVESINGTKRMPFASELSAALCKRFLGDSVSKLSLDVAAEHCIAASDLFTVQEFVAAQFVGFVPTDAHLAITRIRWAGLATTNYDCLVEHAYEQCATSRVQQPVVFLKDGQRIERESQKPNAVRFLKLHGCVSRIDDEELPLILTPDQYVSHRKCRQRLFNKLREWCCEHTIVFVGHSLYDSDIRAVLADIMANQPSFRQCYLIKPEPHAFEHATWSKKNITLIDATFSEFAAALTPFAKPFQGLAALIQQRAAGINIPTAEFNTYTEATQLFITTAIDYVNYMPSPTHVEARDFYRGAADRWQGVVQNLDARRSLVDTVLSEHVIVAADDLTPQLIVLLGHAGSGKSVLLERIALDAVRECQQHVLFTKPGREIDTRAILEVARKLKQRVFVFCDDAVRCPNEIRALLNAAAERTVPITIIASARVNEWNILKHNIRERTSQEYTIRYLSEKEIHRVLERLEANRCLFALEECTHAERYAAFHEKAGRQLLVALYEATHAGQFRDIVLDEYRRIIPILAQRIYLTICVLNRLGVFVRAGIVSRLYDVPFKRFEAEFLAPLEDVVKVGRRNDNFDICYRARHREIAEIVFRGALVDENDRLEFYIGALRFLDLDYQSDRDAFNQMISAKSVREFFPSAHCGDQVYAEACNVERENAFVLHQRGLYWMNVPDANLTESGKHLLEASRLRPDDTTILHSLAELELRKAQVHGVNRLVAEKHLVEARRLCGVILTQKPSTHARHTLIKASVAELKLLTTDEKIADTELTVRFEDLQKRIEEGLRRNPSDEYLLRTAGELALWLNELAVAKGMLEKAFSKNPRNRFFAKALIDLAIKSGDVALAVSYGKMMIEARPNDPDANYAYAKLGISCDHLSVDDMVYYSAKSYMDGDVNFDARLLHGRALYLAGKFPESRVVFQKLSRVEMTFRRRTMGHYPEVRLRQGAVRRIDATHFMIDDLSTGKSVFAHNSLLSRDQCDNLRIDDSIRFRLAFSFRGPLAVEVELGSPV